MRKWILFLVFTAMLLSCEDENLNNIAENQFVIEAFIYAGEPIEDIRIKTIFPLADEDDTSVPIDNAQVALFKNGQRYDLVSSGGDGLYNYPNNDLSVETGDVFQLEVMHDGITATAETSVPTPTQDLTISIDSLKVPQLPLTQGRDAIVAAIRDFIESSSVEAKWSNADRELYFMVVESVGELGDPIFPDQVLEALSRFRFVSEPTSESSLQFLAGSLSAFGTYSVRVYHINKEYADLYENLNQDSRDLNEPPSNVNNALGVFSAFNSAEKFFEVVRDN